MNVLVLNGACLNFLLTPPQLQHWPTTLVLLNFAQVASQLPAPVLPLSFKP
jgi:hypothetical protein